jgi:hypothetical protein
LNFLSPYLVDVRWKGQPYIKGYPKLLCCFDLLNLISEKLDWRGSLEASRSLSEEHCGALRAVEINPTKPIARVRVCWDKSLDTWREAMDSGT